LPPLIFAAEKTGKKIVHFPLSKFGLDIYGLGTVATEKMMKEKPKVIRGFIRASMRGASYAIAHPDEAMGYLLKVSPDLGRKVHRAVWDIMADHLLVPEVKKNGLGFMSAGKWKATRDALLKTRAISVDLPVNEIYTNEFLPKPPIFPGKRGPRVFPSIF
jgi:NitT/TauT family transport system substrate-binding protein